MFTLCRNVGKGYFLLASNEKETLHNAPMLSPYKSKWGTCMFQSWFPKFNLENPSNSALPTWVPFRNLSYAHHDHALCHNNIPRRSDGDWYLIDYYKRSKLLCESHDQQWVGCECYPQLRGGHSPYLKVLIGYENHPFRCKTYLSWKHRVRDCKDNQSQGTKILKRPTHPQQQIHQSFKNEKWKQKEVEVEGFQQVQTWRENTMINIFEVV